MTARGGEREGFVLPRRDGFRVLGLDRTDVSGLMEALLPDPDSALGGAEVFKRGSRNHAVRLDVGGRPYFLKRYNCLGWLYRLGNAFRSSRAVRTWRMTLAFAARGIPVPEPLLCLEERRFRLLGRSYLVSELVEGGESLHLLWPRLDEGQRREVLMALADVLGRMHATGAFHGDLKWNNILVRPGGGSPRVVLVDLDGSSVGFMFRRRRARKDIDRFLKDLDVQGHAPHLVPFFHEAWRCRMNGE